MSAGRPITEIIINGFKINSKTSYQKCLDKDEITERCCFYFMHGFYPNYLKELISLEFKDFDLKITSSKHLKYTKDYEKNNY